MITVTDMVIIGIVVACILLFTAIMLSVNDDYNDPGAQV